ncbi:MAG: PEP/pyruvate-binding domain-containing protein [Proteobacteria bacterium]|nr:PEP/pyruvate-binding domain-containing protein [Pseudomonadota bacterium]
MISICKPAASIALAAIALAMTGCDDESWQCVSEDGAEPDYLMQLGCQADFQQLASEPLNASIPGARSAKTVIDRSDSDALYVQNSKRYPIHWEFAGKHLSGDGRPIVPGLAQFLEQYYSPDRRFLLGALTYYEGPQVWAYEISPYDTASADMIENAYQQISANGFFGDELFVHPTSQTVAEQAAKLPAGVRVITTEQLFAGIDYQPLNLGTSMGQLRFASAETLDTSYVGFRDIVVLDAVPNDISVATGLITAQFQTPLSHVNVLSQNRGTPNMALRGAFDNTELRALDSKWVKLEVKPFGYTITEVTREQADQWFESHRPDRVQVPALDLSVTELRDIDKSLQLDNTRSNLGDELARAIPAFGGKASHYGAFPHMSATVPHPDGFAIPVYYYRQHMERHDFDATVTSMLADHAFRNDPAVHDARLAELREAIIAAPLDSAFEALVVEKLNSDFPGVRMRFRSSTNAEDLAGFTGAGLYTSKSGDPRDPQRPVADAIRTVWASVWFFRAFEEREYRGIDHQAVGMALLVHRSFPDEEANGVAITANLFDRSDNGSEPGFYVNVQFGEASVVKPEKGITTDQLIYFYDFPGKPIVFLAHSSLVAPGTTVLTRAQTEELGQALDEIHRFFLPLYGSGSGFYAMDVEFKFDGEPGQQSALFVKQARPHPGWGL